MTESESEDGTKSTEIIKPDGSIRLILEDPDGIKTVTNYDSQLYPQSKVVYDEEGSKKSETTYKYDENEPEVCACTEPCAKCGKTRQNAPLQEGFLK